MTDSAIDPALDAAPVDTLELAFTLPDEIAENAVLVAVYNEIRDRLRREAAGLPMGTVQTLLMERICFTYVLMKYKEQTGSFARTNEQKDFYAFWLSMTQEFNKILVANQDKLREALLDEVAKLVNKTVLAHVKDPEERKSVRRALSEEFAAIGL